MWHEIFAEVYFCRWRFFVFTGTNFCDEDRLVFPAGNYFLRFSESNQYPALIIFSFLLSTCNSIQLSPEGEVNSGGIYQGVKRRGIYLALLTDPEGDSCLSIYQISWIKVTFCKLKTSLSRNSICNLQDFRGFCRVHFYDFVADSA